MPQAPWREWNEELKAHRSSDWSPFGQEQLLQGGYERRDEKLRRGTLNVSDPEPHGQRAVGASRS